MPNKITQEQFITCCNKIHNNKYDYSKTIYKNALSKLIIICPIHGDFQQTASTHKIGHGCKRCATETTRHKTALTQDEFIKKSLDKYKKYNYDYSKTIYKNINTKVEIICPQHGSFFPLPSNYLYGNKIGCRKCAENQTKYSQRSNTSDFVDKALDIHQFKYSYKNVNYINNTTPVIIECNIHGNFEQTPMLHLHGCGCPRCGEYENHQNKIKNYTDMFFERIAQIHNNKYDYSLSIYNGQNNEIIVKCPIHGYFNVNANNHLRGTGCLQCSPISRYEDQIKQYLQLHHIDFIQHYKELKDDIGKLELDFFIPSKHLGIEVNGLHWHSENSGGKDKKYHLRKTELCEKHNIRLIHILSSEFQEFSKIENKLNILFGINTHKYHARKCTVKEINIKMCSEFLEKHHLQGNDRSRYKLGLFNEDVLLAVMTFSLPRICMGYKNKTDFMEMSRYCVLPGCIINGGASKLLSYFENNYITSKIITFADRRWSTSSFYEKIGFTLDHVSPPNYWYFKQGRDTHLFHRFGFRKNILNSKLQTFNPLLTEWENMKLNNYDRIWDCGNYVFVKNISN